MSAKNDFRKLSENYSPKINAYLEQIRKGWNIKDKTKIVQMLSDGPKTLEHFVLSGLKIQTASARLSDLEDEGIVYKKADNHGSFSWYYLENDVAKQELNQQAKLLEKKLKWLKCGLNIGAITKEEHDELAIKFV
jgi:chaperonin cofactor prefoldin